MLFLLFTLPLRAFAYYILTVLFCLFPQLPYVGFFRDKPPPSVYSSQPVHFVHALSVLWQDEGKALAQPLPLVAWDLKTKELFGHKCFTVINNRKGPEDQLAGMCFFQLFLFCASLADTAHGGDGFPRRGVFR